MIFYALDFDRTLGRTVDIARDFIGFVEQEDVVTGESLRQQQQETEATGGSFDVIGSLRAQIGQRVSNMCESFVVQEHSDAYLEDGADELLHSIQNRGNQIGILTYGGEDWQMTKLRITRLDSFHRIILQQKGEKGALIASWYDAERKVYQLPEALGGSVCQEVVLVDDKPVEFGGFPDLPSARGYLYVGGMSSEAAASIRPAIEDLPTNVTVVDSLRDIVRQEIA